MSTMKLSREELAALEVGKTKVSTSLAIVMSCLFLAVVFLIPVIQEIIYHSTKGNPVLSQIRSVAAVSNSEEQVLGNEHGAIGRVKMRNDLLLRKMGQFEDDLEETSFLRSLFLVPGQRLLLSLFDQGNEKVYTGKHDWLFYSPDMEYLFGPPFLSPDQLEKRYSPGQGWGELIEPDPVKGIVSFRNALKELGIDLLIIPTPVKATVHPEQFGGVKERIERPLQNRSWKPFLERMKAAGVKVFDPAPLLLEYSRNNRVDTYLKTDTHWTPDGMDFAANNLAAFVTANYDISYSPDSYQRVEKEITNRGDIDVMLQLPEDEGGYPQETVVLTQVVNSANELWRARSDSKILLLGDSFSNIYSLAGMGWGTGGGFAEQLSYHLQYGVDTILQNDGGAGATRKKLSRALAQGQDVLAGKKLVIWQFATRELAQGNWRDYPLLYQEKEPGEFYVQEGVSKRRVKGVVADLSRSPRPGSVPYKDNIITLHLSGIEDVETGEQLGEALVYVWGMQDSILRPITSKRNGDEVELLLIDWLEVESEYSSYRRSTLDDEMIEYELPNWGEIIYE